MCTLLERVWAKSRNILLVTFLCLYIGVLLGNLLTRTPWVDEVYVANPAFNVVQHGSIGTSCIEMSHSHWIRIDRYTFNTFPLAILDLVASYKLFGFSLTATRLPSMLWAAVLLFSVYSLMISLQTSHSLAALSTALLAVDYNFMLSSTFARPDSMCAALGFSALAVYCALRLRSTALAVLIATTLAMLSVFTHPNGVLFAISLFLIEAVRYRFKLDWKHTLLAVVPIAVISGSWLAFVSLDWQAAAEQLRSNNYPGRTTAFLHPLVAIRDEVIGRYLTAYGLTLGEHPSGPVRARGIVLIVYSAGLISSFLVPELRKSRTIQLILALWALFTVYFTFFEGTRFTYYILLVTPFYTMLLGATMTHFWRTGRKELIMVLFTGMTFLQMGGIVYRSLQDSYHRAFLPAVVFLKSRAFRDDLVFANSDFAFSYGFERNVKEEMTIGYRSGLVPTYIVIDPNITGLMRGWRTKEPDIYAFMVHRLESYRKIYDHSSYQIYETSAAAGPARARVE